MLTDFHGNEAKRKIFEKIFENGRLKKNEIFKTANSQNLVLGLVKLIDAKGIDVAQPTWS